MEKALRDLGCEEKELSILFTDDERIKDLNRNYRGKDTATNVLAFPMNDPENSDIESPMLGDIVISVDTARQEALETECPLERRIMELLVHGLLHLMDYDHERSDRDEKIMMKEEERLLSVIMQAQ